MGAVGDTTVRRYNPVPTPCSHGRSMLLILTGLLHLPTWVPCSTVPIPMRQYKMYVVQQSTTAPSCLAASCTQYPACTCTLYHSCIVSSRGWVLAVTGDRCRAGRPIDAQASQAGN